VRFSSAVRTRFSRLIFDLAPSGRSCDAVQLERIVLATFQRSSARRVSTPSEESLCSASETVGRRLATRPPMSSWVSGMSMTMPSAVTPSEAFGQIGD
jgi:hypothetical protein